MLHALVRGDGLGGRNQEIALAAAVALDDQRTPGPSRCVIASFATDAEDGPTPVAGAFVTADTVLEPMTWPDSVPVQGLNRPQETPLAGWLM